MAKKSDDSDSTEETPKKSKKKLIMIVAPVLVLVLGGGAYFMFFKSSGPKTEPEPVPGAVVTMDPITINLAGGHYLKLGLALQATADAHEEPDGAAALDLAIELFSNRSVAELSSEKTRNHLKEELAEKVEEAYEHGAVMGIYFTQFVMQ